nr:transposase [Halomicrobium mukohataei]
MTLSNSIRPYDSIVCVGPILGISSGHTSINSIYQSLEHKGRSRGVEVLKENEWDTSKTCSRCGDDTKSNRVERGLYVCSSCEQVAFSAGRRRDSLTFVHVFLEMYGRKAGLGTHGGSG